MSIQSAINQGLAVAGALYSQTPEFAEKKAEKLAQAEAKKVGKAIEQNRAAENEIKSEFEKSIAETEKSIAEAPDRKAKTKAKAELKGLKQGQEEALTANAGEYKGLLKSQAELTGDYKGYAAYLAEEAKKATERAKAIKQAKTRQAKKTKEALSEQTSLGLALKDLNLSAEQMKSLKKQLKEKK